MTKEFNKKQVAEIVGIKERQIQYYAEQGIVLPEIDRGEGRGNVRLYSKKNIIEFAIIKELIDWGCSLFIIRNVFESLRLPVSDNSGNVVYPDGYIGAWKTIPKDEYMMISTLKIGVRIKVEKKADVREFLKFVKKNSALVLNIGNIVSLIYDL